MCGGSQAGPQNPCCKLCDLCDFAWELEVLCCVAALKGKPGQASSIHGHLGCRYQRCSSSKHMDSSSAWSTNREMPRKARWWTPLWVTTLCCINENYAEGGREGGGRKEGQKGGNASSDLCSQASCKAGSIAPILQIRNQSQRH